MRIVCAAMVAALVGLGVGAAARAQDPTTPGIYDFYVYSLAWSPAACASGGTNADPRQCDPGKGLGLVPQGLMPQFERGGWPERCGTMRRVPPRVLEAMMEIMPSGSLIETAWAKYGSCTGLSPDEYFAELRATWERLALPDELRNPVKGYSITADGLKAMLVERNSGFGLGPKGISLVCDGAHIVELRLCVDKDLFFRDCPRVEDQCRPGAKLTAP